MQVWHLMTQSWADYKRTLASRRDTGGGDLSTLAMTPTIPLQARPGVGATIIFRVMGSAVLKRAVECGLASGGLVFLCDPENY